MLKKLGIRQFKCFAEAEMNFGDITVLAGANGMGKSSAIQALLLIHQCYQGASEGETYISINDKVHSFLELGSTREILYSEAKDAKITFLIEDEFGNSDQADFGLDKEQVRHLQAKLLHLGEKPSLPFYQYLHYLNAERLGPRNTQNLAAQQEMSVGYQGEYTGQAIAEANRRTFQIAENRQNKATKGGLGFGRQVEAWMDFIIPDVEINIETFDNINQVRIGIRKKGSGTGFLHPNNMGFGISYVLPIVVSALLAKKGSLLIVENPEAHLHPLGQSRVGQFLAKMAGAGVQIVVETHSEHIINGIRIASLRGLIDHSRVIVNFFSQEKNRPVIVQAITLNEKGELREWPKGFFDQEERDLSEIFQLSRKKE